MENSLVCEQGKKITSKVTWRPCNANICRGTLLFILQLREEPPPQFMMINKNTRRLFIDAIAR
jgi:hypothetical protein